MSAARRSFLLALGGFFLVAAAWALALPVNGTYDESRHILRAYAAADGQWRPHGDNRLSFRAPSTLLPANPDCTWLPRSQPRPASCQQPAADTGVVSTETYVARYNPVYYLPVGVPLRLWPNEVGVLLARLVSALLNALMLAAAVWIAARLGSRRLIAAVVLVATPMVVNLAGSVNPNGAEISAAVLMVTALLGLLSRAAPRRVLLALAGVGAFTLITVRQLGPVMFAVDALAIAVLAATPPGRRALYRRDTAAIFGGFVAAGMIVVAGWAVAARSPVGQGIGQGLDLSTGGIVTGLVEERVEFYVRQIVGQFGYGEVTISPVAVALWYLLVAVLVLPALWRSGWRVRLVVVGLVVTAFALLVALEFVFVRSSGWFSHGRYALPILVAAVLVAVDADRDRDRDRDPWYLPVALVAATAPIHLYAVVRVMSRFQVGIEASLDPFGGSWRPPLGSAAPLVVALVGAGLLIAATRFGVVRPEMALRNGNSTETPASTRTVSAN